MLLTQPNMNIATTNYQWHELPFHSMCPVSKNPQQGSALYILYMPSDFYLEVNSLHHYVQSFVNGKGSIRSMEDMLQSIATDCANILRVTVVVGAVVILHNGDTMKHIATGIADDA